MNKFLILLSFFLFACGEPEKMQNNITDSAAAKPVVKERIPDTVRQAAPPASNTKIANANVTVQTFQNNTTDAANGTWGYDIYIDNAVYIHQPSVPAVAGISGFRSESDARKTGQLVSYKIQHNILPPAVTKQELDSLAVLY